MAALIRAKPAALSFHFFLGAGAVAGTVLPAGLGATTTLAVFAPFAAQRFFWAAEINARAAALIVRFFGAAEAADAGVGAPKNAVQFLLQLRNPFLEGGGLSELTG